MKASLKLAISCGLMATMLLPGFLAANADNDKPAADAAKNEAAKGGAKEPQGPYSDVNKRMVSLERRLVEDLANGRLSPSQTEEFQKNLDQVSELEAQFRTSPSKYNHWQNVRLHTLLDKLELAVDKSERDRDLASADLQFTREDLWARIDLAAKQNRLSPQEVSDLKQLFNRISALEAMLHRVQGHLTYVDKLMLCIDYDHLAQRLSKTLSDRPMAMPDVATETADIEKRMDEGQKANKITETQLQEFKQKLSDIRGRNEQSKKAAPSAEQIIALGLDMDLLANRVENLHEAAGGLQAIATRTKEMDHRIAQCFDLGLLNPLETLELKEDLDEIQAATSKLTADGKLKPEDEGPALALDIARLEGRLERQVHSPSRLSPGATVYIAHLSHRIKQGLAAKRLTDDEAKDLRQNLRALNKKKFDMIKADGGISSGQSLSLGGDLQRLSYRLDKTMKDRDMDLPNIEGIRQTLDSRIGDYTVSGQLDAGDAHTLVNTLNELNTVKEKYASSDNTLDNREKFSLGFELERLTSNLEEQMHGHAAFFPGIETRRLQIEALINEGLSSGRLDGVTADIFKQKLQENNKLEKQASDSTGMTGARALEIVGGVERLWEQLDRELREKAVTTADIVSMEGNVEKKIRQGLSYGLLGPGEAESLRMTYDGVVAAFNRMRAEDGGLSYGERLAFCYGFERLVAYSERNLRSTPLVLPNLEAHRAAMEQKIGNLLASGRLPVQEAQDLKSLLDEITMAATEKQASGGGMSYQEGLVVAVDIDRLNHRIEQQAAALKSPLPDVDELQRKAEKRIEDAKAKGEITAVQYKAYKADLDRIAANEAAFRISDESLNYAEAINLMLEIHRLQDKVAMPNKASTTAKKTDNSHKKEASSSDKNKR